MDIKQYLEIFIDEAKEHLQGMNQSLLQLEKNPDDNAMLNEIFRVAHTLKGMAGTMGFNKMARLTHNMENVLHAIRGEEIKVSTSLVDLLFKCLDALENYLGNIIETGNEGSNDYDDIIQALAGITKGKPSGEPNSLKPSTAQDTSAGGSVHQTANFKVDQYEQNVINKAKEANMNVYQITVVLDSGCVLKSARAFIVFQMLERYSEIIKSEPKVEDIEDEKFGFEFTVIVISKYNAEFLSKELYSIAEIQEVLITPLEAKAIDVDEAKKEEAKSSATTGNLAVHQEADEAEGEAAAQKHEATSRRTRTGKTVRVDIDRLDVLLNLVSELIIQKTRLEGLEGIERTQTYNETVEYLERITTSLHDAVMKVRMVPVEAVFNRFPRMVRDISRELGKEIVLTMSGEETELDRTVIDEIGDPLIHLLRNSIDHGIEPIEKRRELKKPEEGHIYLRAYQDGNTVVIEVEDDGEGINLEKVKRKAIEKGMISQDIANSMTKKEIIDLLFRPSFSTADKITDISGRGVGLDVVKTKIEALGGGGGKRKQVYNKAAADACNNTGFTCVCRE